jgi:FtsP/CotA-like multicopper oxidase with cupredoxin domain
VVVADPQGGGELNPTINLRPGEVQRWRIINAQASGTGGGAFARISTNVPDLEMYQIAYDGLTLSKRVEIDQSDKNEPWLNPASMAPGNRMDVMVRVPIDASEQNMFMDMASKISDLLAVTSNTNRIGINIEISGDPVTHDWSDDPVLPANRFVDFTDEPLPKRTINFAGGFALDGAPFTGDITQTMKLGTAEEWTIENGTSAVHAHHIHVNPFLITHINGVELERDNPLRRWQDTIAIPFAANDGPGTITYKTRFERFTGKFVIHCHVLRHEDRGMMQTVEVVS